MGLIARFLEAQGFATLSLTAAWSITASVNPPRAAFLDFPLGYTAGRPNQPEEQLNILADALTLFEKTEQSGDIVPLPYGWGSNWKHLDLDGDVDWPPRYKTLQYQSETDRDAALKTHGKAAIRQSS